MLAAKGTLALAWAHRHDGITFGFWSNQGYFPALRTAIALYTNQDHDTSINYSLTCAIVGIVAKHLGVANATGIAALQCNPLPKSQ